MTGAARTPGASGTGADRADLPADAYTTVRVRVREPVCYLRLDRPEQRNAISDTMLRECRDVLARCARAESISVVVLQGGPEFFCLGADFGLQPDAPDPVGAERRAADLYDLLLDLAGGPYVSVAQVRGKATAGGVGLAAACDLVVADATARFSLSELLFGVYPACVLPFLVRRCGFQPAHRMALSTTEFTAAEAAAMRLADVVGEDAEVTLRRQLLRLRYLPKSGVARYKRYALELDGMLRAARGLAVAGNAEAFSDPGNLRLIRRYASEGIMPWE